MMGLFFLMKNLIFRLWMGVSSFLEHFIQIHKQSISTRFIMVAADAFGVKLRDSF